MAKPQPGNYLFVHYGYNGDKLEPILSLLGNATATFEQLNPRNSVITLRFDTSKRYCTGWHDLETSESHPCPNTAEVPDQYEQCHHCRNKTGFNPAFYNAASISEQQKNRNQQPHSLYLAHFGPKVVKVGITWAGRGIRRLLDQGARSAIVVKTYPNADIARQYEAKIAKLSGIAETLQVRAKNNLLNSIYDAQLGAQELRATLERVINEVGLTTDSDQPQHFDDYYLDGNTLLHGKLIDVGKDHFISGKCIGMIGSTLITEQDGLQFTLPLSKLKGYQVDVKYEEEAVDCGPQQVSLF